MANISAPISTMTSPTSWGSRDAIKGTLTKIWNKFSGFIKKASESSGIPPSVIASFIAVESGGETYSKFQKDGHITQGLMQWNRDYAKSNIEKEIKNGDLSEYEKKVLTDAKIIDSAGKVRAVTNADQKNEEVNIVIGTIILGQMIDQAWAKTSTGELPLDRIIAVYNAGAYGTTGQKARQLTTITKYNSQTKKNEVVEQLKAPLSTPQTLAANVNSTTRAYIYKMLGKNGAMDIALSDLKDIIKN